MNRNRKRKGGWERETVWEKRETVWEKRGRDKIVLRTRL